MAILKKKIDIGLIIAGDGSSAEEKDRITDSVRKVVDFIKTSEDLNGYEVFFTLIPFSNEIDTKNSIEFRLIDEVEADSINLEFYGKSNPAPAIDKFVNKGMERYSDWKSDRYECCHPVMIFLDGSKEPLADEYQAAYEVSADKVKAYEEKRRLLVISGDFGAAQPENIRKLTVYPERVVKLADSDIDKLTELFMLSLLYSVGGYCYDGIGDFGLFRYFD